MDSNTYTKLNNLLQNNSEMSSGISMNQNGRGVNPLQTNIAYLLQMQEMMKGVPSFGGSNLQNLQSLQTWINLQNLINLQQSQQVHKTASQTYEFTQNQTSGNMQFLDQKTKREENTAKTGISPDFLQKEESVKNLGSKSDESCSALKIRIQLASERDQSLGEEEKEKPKYFKCHFKDCDKIFPKESNLNDHIRTHTGEKPFKCSFENCGKSFSQLGNLKKHETVHLGEKAFYCEYPGCGKGFSAMYNLKIHSRSHSGEKPYKCRIDGCDREFYDKGNLKYHEKTSHSYEIKNLPFSCEHVGCNLKFKTKKQKLIHHHNLEPDCKNEKYSIIKLLALYKKFTNNLIEKSQLDRKALEDDSEFQNLRTFYEEVEKKILDPDFFYMTMGENFNDMPKEE